MSSAQITNIDYTRKDLPKSFGKAGIALFIVGISLVILSYLIDPTRSAFNNLLMLMFLCSIGVGSLFWVAVEYIGGAVWSVPFRRVLEFLGATLIILPIVALPLFFNMHGLFHWTHAEEVMNDPLLKGKVPYLNIQFFVIRVLAFFAIWLLFYFFLTKRSLKQDKTKDQILTKKNIRLSAIFIPVFAITITFAAIDWMMSLEPHWFSTIFGVYYFSGTVLAALAMGTFIIIYLNEHGILIKGIQEDHYYSLGALLFGFINFWAYIAFSQFLLIYYANLPEETFWFIDRWHGSWLVFSVFLIFVHFVIPYFGLLSQSAKMNPKRLKLMSLWILFAHFVDLYWIIMPTYSPEGVVISWFEVGFVMLTFGILILVFGFRARNKNLVPIGDPKLKRALDFRL